MSVYERTNVDYKGADHVRVLEHGAGKVLAREGSSSGFEGGEKENWTEPLRLDMIG